MASYSNYVRPENKATNREKYDALNRVKNPKKKFIPKDERLREGFKKWTSFYRANPHRFGIEYLGLRLHLFQQIIIYYALKIDFFMWIASRGIGKSWIVAVIAVIRCILYPGTKVGVVSFTKNQARLIISQKIKIDLMGAHPNLAREIKEIKDSQNRCIIYFHNGSTIEAVTSTESSRGYRFNMLILDEFRLIDKDVVNKILRPFLNVMRQPGYLVKPEYKHLVEENKELYISSAHYKSGWMWEKFLSFTKLMLKGKSNFVCAHPYTLPLYHGLLSKSRIEQIRSESDFDPITDHMEMKSLFFGENENAFFKSSDLQKSRTIVKPFYPANNIDFVNNKNKRKKSNKQEGEIRIIGVDVAMLSGKKNDLTVFTCMRCLPSVDQFTKQISYIETLDGVHSEIQAIRLKQIFNDFEADFAAIDTNGNGVSLYDAVSKIQYDEERDVEYPAWVAMNDDKMKNRTTSSSAIPCIYSVKQQNAKVNHEVAVKLRDDFKKGDIKLLVNSAEGKDFLIEKKMISDLPEEQVAMLHPYNQTTALINEMVNLDYETRNGYIKVKETGSNRKDRYSSLGYANYYANILEKEVFKDNNYDEDDPLVYWMRI